MNKSKSAIVFGGSGFLGSHVVDTLITAGYAVKVVDIRRPYQVEVDFLQADILNEGALDAIDYDVDVIFNFVAQPDIGLSSRMVLKTLNLNILGNVRILEQLRDLKGPRYVYASSAYASSDGGSFYGISKWSSERLIKEYSRRFGLEFTIIRYGSVYGPRSDSSNRIYRMIEEALTHGVVTYHGTGEEVREYIHVKDAAELSVRIIAEEYKNRCVVLTGTERLSYAQLLAMIKEMFNNEVSIRMLGSQYDGRYLQTPYQVLPDTAKKLVLTEFYDIGQGMLDLIYELKSRIGDRAGEDTFDRR